MLSSRIVGNVVLFGTLFGFAPSARTQGDALLSHALKQPSGKIACEYEYTIKQARSNPTTSITSATPSSVALKVSSETRIRGRMILVGDDVWTQEGEVGTGIQRVDAILNGRYVSFTVDTRNEMVIEPTGILNTEGHGGFTPVECLRRMLFAKNPAGNGLSMTQVLNAYHLTSSSKEHEVAYSGKGPKPYQASLAIDRAKKALKYLRFASVDPTYEFERKTEFLDWQVRGDLEIPTKVKYRFFESIPGADHVAIENKVEFKITTFLPDSEARSVDVPNGMIFYKIDSDSGKKTAYRYANGKFEPTSDPGNQFKNKDQSNSMYMAAGIIAVVLGMVTVCVHRARRKISP